MLCFRIQNAPTQQRPRIIRKLRGPAIPPVPVAEGAKGSEATRDGHAEGCNATGKIGKTYENSCVQRAEQPSPSVRLPSSHCSLVSVRPLPQNAAGAKGEAAEGGRGGKAFFAFLKRSMRAEKLLACSVEGRARAEGFWSRGADELEKRKVVEGEDEERASSSMEGSTGAETH